MLRLNNLKSPKGAHKNTKRLGRGPGSGQGQQSGKGHKGQKSRSGGGIRTGFEGGAMPLYMRLPKRGFKNIPFKTVYAELNLDRISDKFESGEVSRETLTEKGLLKGNYRKLPIKILGRGDFNKPLVFKNINKFSKSAIQKIENAKGKIE